MEHTAKDTLLPRIMFRKTPADVWSTAMQINITKQGREISNAELDQNLQEAAGAAGGALAGYLFGPEAAPVGAALGEAIYSAIVGNGDDPEAEFRKEVIASLQRIESKLNDVITFLQKDLPQVIRVAVNNAIATNLVLQLEANRTTTLGMLRTLSGQPGPIPDDQFLLAINIANRSFETGIALMHYGQEWYSGVIHAYVNGLALYGRLVRSRKAYYGFLVEYASTYKLFVDACLADAVPQAYWVAPAPNESFAMAKLRIAEEEVSNGVILSDVRAGRVNYLLALNGKSIAYGGWFELVNNGTALNGDDLFILQNNMGIDNFPPQESQEEFISLLKNTYNWKVPSFKPVIQIEQEPRRNGYEEMVQVLWTAISSDARNIVIKPAVLEAVGSLEALRESAGHLAGPKVVP